MINHYKSKVIYISGSGRSGSTLLDIVLSGHSQVTGLGEVHRLSLDPAVRECGCSNEINDCTFWQKSISKAFSLNKQIEGWENKFPVTFIQNRKKIMGVNIPSWLDFLVYNATLLNISILKKLSPKLKYYIDVVIANSWSLYDAIARENNKKFIVDSTKNAIRGKLLHLSRPDDVYFIHLIRDGRAIVNSAKKRGSNNIKADIRNWKNANINIERILKVVPANKVLKVSYDGLCREPEKTLEKIFNFLNVENENRTYERGLDSFPYHQIPGNPLLKNKVKYLRFDDTWKTNLTAEEIKVFNKYAGNLNEKYGFKSS